MKDVTHTELIAPVKLATHRENNHMALKTSFSPFLFLFSRRSGSDVWNVWFLSEEEIVE